MNVVVLDDYQGVATTLGDWASVPNSATVDAQRNHIGDPDELVAVLHDADAIVAMRERTALGRGVLERLPRLRLIVTTGMSNAVVDLEAARELGITVTGTGGILTPTSELTWGLIIALARHIPAEAANVTQGRWQQRMGMGLAGKTLGLVGLGRLGALVAGSAASFGMDVVAWSQNLTAHRCAEVGAVLVTKAELFARADVVSVHLVLSDRTRGIVGAEELRAMKPTALLVNTSRGPNVDEAALVQALEEGWIAGAALDVFDTEPLPDRHPLRVLPNVLATPHIGYATDDCYELFFREIVEDVAAFAAGKPIRVLNS
jgi:phosphoglycerate dehydrogenase-like enzyme